jgi:hypothetical protein
LIDLGRELGAACRDMPLVSRQIQELAAALGAVHAESVSAVAALQEAGAGARALAGQLEQASARRDVLIGLQQAQADLARATEAVARLSQGVALVETDQEWEQQTAPLRQQVRDLTEQVEELRGRLRPGSAPRSPRRRFAWLWGDGNGNGHPKEGT